MGAALQADGETRSVVTGLKHQKEKRSMDHFAGLDVSVNEMSVCIVDDTGRAGFPWCFIDVNYSATVLGFF